MKSLKSLLSCSGLQRAVAPLLVSCLCGAPASRAALGARTESVVRDGDALHGTLLTIASAVVEGRVASGSTGPAVGF